MLPDIPDNDTATCWAPGCQAEVAPWTETGLCLLHRNAVQGMDFDAPTGRLWDRLGMRLNVLSESAGACLRSEGPCDIRLCRYHLDDRGERLSLSEPCSIKMANLGGMKLDDIAAVTGNVTRERIRQLEISGLRSLKRACERLGIRLEDVVGVRAKAA